MRTVLAGVLRHPFTLGSALWLTLAGAWWVFAPALSGPFFFDDIAWLSKLGQNGGIDDAADALNFVTSFSGFPGRPLAMASFLWDGGDWPANPYPFKRTNLLIHLLNGVLVFAWLRLLFRPLLVERANWAAWWVALLWLWHPMQLATIMPVVQRMTELAALFTLSGLIFYTYGRLIIANQPRRGLIYTGVGIGIFTPLAVLCKENGALLPLFALVMEFTLLRHAPLPESKLWLRRWRWWRSILLVAPLALLAGYFIWRWSQLTGYSARSFTMEERLFTQTRALWSYTRQIFLPDMGWLTIYHDDFPKSMGWWRPPETIFSAFGLIAALVLALSRRWLWFSFGVLFFLAGQVLESSFIPLELYFEHRNYLPMVGLLSALVLAAMQIKGRLAGFMPLFALAYVALLTFASYQSAIIWGNEALLSQIWVAHHPESVRASQHSARYWSLHGQFAQAAKVLEQAQQHHSQHAGLALQRMQMLCLDDSASILDIKEQAKRIRAIAPQSPVSFGVTDTLKKLAHLMKTEKCHGETLDAQQMHGIIDALLDNPMMVQSRAMRANFYLAKADVWIHQHYLEPAILSLDKAYQANQKPFIPLLQARLLLSADLNKEAMEYLDQAGRRIETLPWHEQKTYLKPRQRLEQQLLSAMESNASLNQEVDPSI